MNVIDAIKSGRRFKRQKWPCTAWMESTGSFGSSVESMIADDWEIEDVSVTITREKLNEAWREVVTFNEPYSNLILDALAEELGL